jgi:predicted metal-binding membrane protein
MPGYTWTGSAMMFLLMWLAMMAAMMLPSTLPMLLKLRQSSAENKNFAALTLIAASGYFFVWMAIGVAVYALGVAYAMAAMHLDWLSRLTPALSGIMLMVCGMIQFTPWKLSELRRCRAPDCGRLQGSGAVRGGWRYGLKQGMACCLCCTAPMLAMLVLGMMNPAVIIIIAAIIAAEKLLPWPEKLVRLFGAVAFLAGAGIIIHSQATR